MNRVHGTLKSYNYTYKCLATFLETEYKLSDIPFTAIDRSFIGKYDIYLRTQRRLATSTVNFHTTRLMMIVSEAAASVFAIMLLLKFLSCKASNVEKFS